MENKDKFAAMREKAVRKAKMVSKELKTNTPSVSSTSSESTTPSAPTTPFDSTTPSAPTAPSVSSTSSESITPSAPSTPTSSTPSSKINLEEMLEGYIGEIRRVEEELNSQLDELGEKIDKGFKQMAELVVALTDITVDASHNYFSDSKREKIAYWGNMIAKGANVIGETYNAYQHNKALDALLVKKQEMASAKRDSLLRIRRVIDKNHDKLKELIVKEGNKYYEASKLENGSIRKMLFNNMDRISNAYKAAEYVSLASEYLLAEYNAWLNGKQRSNIARPTYLDVHQNIIELLAPGKTNKARMLSQTISSNPSGLYGNSLYFLHDASLSSVLLIGEATVQDKYNPEFSTFITREVPEVSSNLIDEILLENEAFQAFKSFSSEYYELKVNPFILIFYLLSCIAVIYGTWYIFHNIFEDWATWLRWVLGIITGGVFINIVTKFYEIFEKRVDEKQEILDQALKKDLLDKAGYFEIQEPDLKKKDVWGTAISGALDMVEESGIFQSSVNNVVGYYKRKLLKYAFLLVAIVGGGYFVYNAITSDDQKQELIIDTNAPKCYGQVNDPDGYTNIRRGPSTNDPIVGRYNSGDYIYYTPLDNGWSKVYSGDKENTFLGYMHTSRIIEMEENNSEEYSNSNLGEEIEGVMDLQGYIGKYPITMHLNIEGENVNGTYHYNSSSSELLLSGTLEGNHIELNETTEEGRPTGHFDGIISDGDFSGEFINYKGEHFNFSLR